MLAVEFPGTSRFGRSASLLGYQRKAVVDLKAYFDESGDQRVLTVGGLVATAELWDREFKPGWLSLLEQWDIPFMRRSLFENRKPPFDSLKAREVLADDMAKIIRRTVMTGFAVSVLLDDWNARASRFRDIGIFHPYHWCAFFCAQHLVRNPSNASLVFEAGAAGEGHLHDSLKALARHHGAMPDTISLPKDQCLELQSADFFAYEAFKHAQVELGLATRPLRRSMVALLGFDGGGSPEAGLSIQRMAVEASRPLRHTFQYSIFTAGALDDALDAPPGSPVSYDVRLF